jgi:hypothetical protein
MADDRPRFSDEDIERICSVLSKRDAAGFRAYHAHMEGRERTVYGDTVLSIAASLRDVHRIADDAVVQGKINGGRLDTLSDTVKGMPASLEAMLSAHEARAMEALRPVHAAAFRVMQAEAVALELQTERERIELDARRKQLERDHTGAMETRALGLELLRRAPWTVVLAALAAAAGGASLAEVMHIVSAGIAGVP